MIRLRVLLAVVLAVAVMAAPAWALTKDSTLTNPGGTLTMSLHAVADWDAIAGNFLYTYELTYVSTTIAPSPTIHEFSVDSGGALPFFAASNTDGFANPVFDPLNTYAVSWLQGTMPLGSTVTFGYHSDAVPTDIMVFASALNGGYFASGETIGMGAYIPEPSSFASLIGLASFGAGSLLRRRRGR